MSSTSGMSGTQEDPLEAIYASPSVLYIGGERCRLRTTGNEIISQMPETMARPGSFVCFHAGPIFRPAPRHPELPELALPS